MALLNKFLVLLVTQKNWAFVFTEVKKKNSQALRSVVFGFIASKQERKLTTYANTKIKKSKKLNNILKVNIFLNQDF